MGSLAACTPTTSSDDADSADTSSSECTPTASGDLSDAVEVTGDFGALPTVAIDAPVSAEATERSVVIEGDGDVAQEGDIVNVDFVLYSATTGEEVTGTTFEEGTATPWTLDEAQFLPGLVKTLECSTVGSRVVGVLPPVDTWGDVGAEGLGVAATDTVVLVADVVSIAPAIPDKADGVPQDPEEGFPTVELADDGTPTVTIPDAAAPTELMISTLQLGDGTVVAEGDSVTVQYQGLDWDTGEIFDQSWGSAPATFATDQVVEGFGDALVGQTVGSQVIVVMPPALGYGEASADNTSELAGKTLVFVIDILATTAA
jgi:peptidylprolyl isomerase